MAEHPAPWPKEGLSPQEAYSRTLSPSLKARFTEPPRRRILSLGFDVSENDRRLIKMWNAEYDRKANLSESAKQESISTFHSYLREGLLVATGHKTEKDANEYRIEGQPSPVPIRREAWDSLRIHWRRGSAGIKIKKPERFGLKIFPLLSSPLAVEMLKGLTLPEAFARYVAGDPELRAAEEGDGDDAGSAAWRSFHRPLFDRFGIWWKVSTKYPEAAKGENPIGFLNGESGGTAAYNVAQARIAVLFELLQADHLQAVGVDENGNEKLLPLSFWLSQNGYVDFKEGDAFLLNEKGKLVLVASGISLRVTKAPNAEVPAVDRTANIWRLKRRETAKEFAARFIDDRPSEGESPEAEIEKAGGLGAFADAVAAASDGWLSSDSIRKAIAFELKVRREKQLRRVNERG